MKETQLNKFKARIMVKVPDVLVISILKRIKEGATLQDMAQEFSIPKGTILGWCTKAGIHVPRKKRDWESIKLALGIT